MARKSAHQAAQAKAAKEKKILIALAVPFAIALFYAYHTITKLNHGSAPVAVAPPATTTPTSTAPTGTTESATPSAPGVTPLSGAGKLASLTFLASKDPFHDQGPHTNASSTPSKKGAGGAAKHAKTSSHHKHHAAKKTTHHKRAAKTPTPPAPPPTSAIIGVNGHLTNVTIGAAFPVTNDGSTNGIFRLVSLTKKTAKIAVVGGSYASGAQTITLRVDVSVTLVNTADGKRYTLVLYPQGTPAPPGSGGTSTTTTPVTTTTPGG